MKDAGQLTLEVTAAVTGHGLRDARELIEADRRAMALAVLDELERSEDVPESPWSHRQRAKLRKRIEAKEWP